jgi:ParB-like chromosome segregation protein Spo0J
VEHVLLEEISPDPTFRLRDPGDVSDLATAIGRLGQLTPIDLRPLPGAGDGKRFQVVAGFRRMEALRMLQRERVLARVHPSIPDPDAWALALAGNLFARPWTPADLDTVAQRVRAHLPWAAAALKAVRRPAGDPSSAAHSLAVRAYELNGEVAAAYEGWSAVPAEARRLVLEQLRYLARILPLLEKENR